MTQPGDDRGVVEVDLKEPALIDWEPALCPYCDAELWSVCVGGRLVCLSHGEPAVGEQAPERRLHVVVHVCPLTGKPATFPGFEGFALGNGLG